MSEPISLAALRAAHEAATSGPWFVSSGGLLSHTAPFGSMSENRRKNDAAIVAEHNATSVLLEIVEAALRCVYEWPTRAELKNTDAIALVDALAKVKP